jgi:hypothetical protein
MKKRVLRPNTGESPTLALPLEWHINATRVATGACIEYFREAVGTLKPAGSSIPSVAGSKRWWAE